jgi:hypothetical protein
MFSIIAFRRIIGFMKAVDRPTGKTVTLTPCLDRSLVRGFRSSPSGMALTGSCGAIVANRLCLQLKELL